MGVNKKYSGYKSFQYLEPDKDYKVFKLAKEIGRVEQYTLPLSKSEEERVQEIIRESVIVDLHEHPQIDPEDLRKDILEYNLQGRFFIGYEGLSVSGVDAVFDFMMDGIPIYAKRHGKWGDVIYDLGMRLSDIAHQDFVIKGETVEDILKAHKNGQVAIIFGLEEATPIENEIDRVDVLYGLGIRCMGITYGDGNALGAGQACKKDYGLTDFGYEVVERMNKLGMAIDISHSSDRTALEVIEASRDPVLINHTGARSVWPSVRMMPDEVLQACAEKGGLIGIEAAPHTTISKKHPEHSIESVMDHFEYCVELVGIDHVGFGLDLEFGDHVALHEVFSEFFGSMGRLTEKIDYPKVPYVKGLESLVDFPNIVRWLVKHGYSDKEIKKVIGENALRVLKKIWGK